MARTDGNEVFAIIGVCQDVGALEGFAKLCEERAELMQTRRDGKGRAIKSSGQPFIGETVHTAGGSSQPPMTGPCSALPINVSTAEQAVINDRMLQAQAKEGRLDKAGASTLQVGAREGEQRLTAAVDNPAHQAVAGDVDDKTKKDEDDKDKPKTAHHPVEHKPAEHKTHGK